MAIIFVSLQIYNASLIHFSRYLLIALGFLTAPQTSNVFSTDEPIMKYNNMVNITCKAGKIIN